MFDFTVPIPLRDPRYTRAELLAVVPTADPEILNQWISRELLPLDGENPGKGRRRLFSGADVIRIAIVTQLTGFCVSVAAAAKTAEICLDWTLNHQRPNWGDYFLIQTPAYRFDQKMQRDHFHSGHAYFQVLGVQTIIEHENVKGVSQTLYPSLTPRRPSHHAKLRSLLSPGDSSLRAIAYIPIGEIINTVLVRLIVREAVENPELLDDSGLRAIIDGKSEE